MYFMYIYTYTHMNMFKYIYEYMHMYIFKHTCLYFVWRLYIYKYSSIRVCHFLGDSRRRDSLPRAHFSANACAVVCAPSR